MKNISLAFGQLCILLIYACHPAEKQASNIEAPVVYQNDGHRLVAASVAKTGNYEQLKSLVDVSFDYTYISSDGDTVVFVEKYIFDGEKSWSSYTIERKDSLEERVEGFDGKEAWLTVNGKAVTDEKKLKNTRISRKTSFYLFAMNQKLLDPGLLYRFVRKDTVAGQFYDVVEVTFQDNIGDCKDIYHVYINEETKLIDQYLLTILAYDVTEPEIVRCTYEQFGPVFIPTYRKYTASNWDGDVLEEKWNEEISENLKFNQSVKIERPKQNLAGN